MHINTNVSAEQHAKDEISLATRALLKSKVADKILIGEHPQPWYLQHLVPADGLCLWHALLASMDFESFLAVPLTSTGWAQNRRIVQKEELLAKSLRDLSLEKGAPFADKSRLQTVQATGETLVHDLRWICPALY